MVFDNYSGKQFMMGIAKRIFLCGVIVGLVLAGLFYLALKLIF